MKIQIIPILLKAKCSIHLYTSLKRYTDIFFRSVNVHHLGQVFALEVLSLKCCKSAKSKDRYFV